MARKITFELGQFLEFNQKNYSIKSFEKLLEDTEVDFVNLVSEMQEEVALGLAEDLEAHMTRMFNKSSNRGDRVRKTTGGRVQATRRTPGSTYYSINQPVFVERVHGSRPGMPSSVLQEGGVSSRGGGAIVAKINDKRGRLIKTSRLPHGFKPQSIEVFTDNYVYNLLDAGRKAVQSSTFMKFPITEGNLTRVGSLTMNNSVPLALTEEGGVQWVNTKRVASVPARGFYQQLLNKRTTSGSAVSRRLRSGRIRAAEKRLDGKPIGVRAQLDPDLFFASVEDI